MCELEVNKNAIEVIGKAKIKGENAWQRNNETITQ